MLIGYARVSTDDQNLDLQRLRCALALPAFKIAAAAILTLLIFAAIAQALIAEQDLLRADAIVVFSGAAAYRERVDFAAQLLAEGAAPKIILSDDGVIGGWSPADKRNLHFVEKAKRELQGLGISETKIDVAGQARGGTYGETKLIRDFAERQGLRSVLFVTSTYHSRRALWTVRRIFKDSGIQVGLRCVPAKIKPTQGLFSWWLHRSGWAAISSEYVKGIYYWYHYG